MNGQEKLYILAFIVSVIVVFGIAITFLILYIFQIINKKRILNAGLDDIKIKKDFVETFKKKYYKFIKKEKNIEKSISIYSFEYISKNNNISLTNNEIDLNKYFKSTKEAKKYQYLYIKNKTKNKRLNLLSDIILSIFILFTLALLGVSLSYRINNESFFINNSTYFTIMSSSMETKNKNNSYLVDNNLDDQIEQYSLIGIDKIGKEEDIKLYDILAYKHDDTIIIHRLIGIGYDDKTNSTYYTLRGDANNGSLTYELKLKFDDIVGKYNGFQNYHLGVFLTYFQSSIGLIAISATFLFLFGLEISESILDKKYRVREELIINELKDYEIIKYSK